MNTNDCSMLSCVVVYYLLIQAKIFNRFDCTEIDFTWDSAQIEYFDGNLRFVFNAGRWQILVFLPNNFAGIGVTYNHPIAANTRTHTGMATNVLQWASPVRVTMRAYDNSQNKGKSKKKKWNENANKQRETQNLHLKSILYHLRAIFVCRRYFVAHFQCKISQRKQ